MTANKIEPNHTGWTRVQIAQRVAKDIVDGWSVNLGIGLPSMVADFISPEREVIFHSENGILGVGPTPPPENVSLWLTNASKKHVTLRPGGSFFHQAESFALIRGGHLDLCVLGAYQVAANGDLANWTTNDSGAAPAVGGAMDLAAATPRIWVMMEHCTRKGEPRLVNQCTYPLTAPGVVKRVYTDLAVLDISSDGFHVVDSAPGVDRAYIQERTDGPLL